MRRVIIAIGLVVTAACSSRGDEAGSASTRLPEAPLPKALHQPPPVPPSWGRPAFTTREEAIAWVRAKYDRDDQLDASHSSWITSGEYYLAEGKGYLILGMRGKPHIFENVPSRVWREFRDAPSLEKYYKARIEGRYGFDLSESHPLVREVSHEEVVGGILKDMDDMRVPRPLRLWWAVLRQADSSTTRRSFVPVAKAQLRRVAWDGALETKAMKERAALGILMASPDSSFVLDPLVGYEIVGPQGEMGTDVDTGFSLFASKSGARTYSWVTTLDHVVWAFWTDSSTAVLGGWCMQEEPGAPMGVQPMILVVSASSGHMTKFVGPRIPEDFRTPWRTAMRAVYERSFPRIQWPE